MLKYSFGDFYGQTEFETASGTIEAQYVKIKKFYWKQMETIEKRAKIMLD